MIYKREAALTFIEFLVAICIISVLMGVFAFSMIEVTMAAKEVSLQNELSNWRHAIELYRAMHGSYPLDLGVLINREYTYGIAGQNLNAARYIEVYRLDEEGLPLDPFGGKYIYNSYNGEVHSKH